MEEVGLREDSNDTGNMSKHVQSLVNMARWQFGGGCLGVIIAQRLIQVMIPPQVFLVKRDIIFKFVLLTLAPKIDMPLRDDVDHYTQGNLQAMLLRPVSNA
jgi:hypothetical protein